MQLDARGVVLICGLLLVFLSPVFWVFLIIMFFILYFRQRKSSIVPVSLSVPRVASLPEGAVKGEAFEEYVLSLFSRSDWDLVQRTQSWQSNSKRYEKKSEQPDFRFQHKVTKKYFNVECKFRSGLNQDGKIQWCKQYQFRRYLEFDKYKNTYIVIGFQGVPELPAQMFLIPLLEIKYCGLYPVSIERYLRPVHVRFQVYNGSLS